MKIDIDTEQIEEYAKRLAKQRMRNDVGLLIKGEMEAIKNFSQLKQDLWSLHATVRRMNERLEKLEKRKWWKK